MQPGHKANQHLHLVGGLRKNAAVLTFSHAFMTFKGTTSLLLYPIKVRKPTKRFSLTAANKT
jgi:hypothetical protein